MFYVKRQHGTDKYRGGVDRYGKIGRTVLGRDRKGRKGRGMEKGFIPFATGALFNNFKGVGVRGRCIPPARPSSEGGGLRRGCTTKCNPTDAKTQVMSI